MARRQRDLPGNGGGNYPAEAVKLPPTITAGLQGLLPLPRFQGTAGKQQHIIDATSNMIDASESL